MTELQTEPRSLVPTTRQLADGDEPTSAPTTPTIVDGEQASLRRSWRAILRDVDPAAAEAAFAIHQIVTPELVKGLAETGEPTFRNRQVVLRVPYAQSLGIILAERLTLLPAQPAIRRK